MPITNVSHQTSTDTLHASEARIATGNATAVEGFAVARQMVVLLDVSAADGTAPTLDVIIQDTVDGTNYRTIGTFAQKVATGQETIGITIPFTNTIRARYTIAGTDPSFTFAVKVYSEA